MPETRIPKTALESLRAALEFAAASGAWLVAGEPPEPRKDALRPAPSSAAPEVSGVDGAPRLLEAVRSELGECRRCRLSEGRTHLVFGVGSPVARLLFVGEGPGEEEDRRGEPFVGRAGRLLDRMIAALGLRRADVYIANVLKCRPPGNRDPQEDEAAACAPFLWRQIDAVGPRVICTLGAHAARAVLGVSGSVAALRGRTFDVRGRVVLATYHPAYLLRNPAAKRLAWDDLRKVRDALEGVTRET